MEDIFVVIFSLNTLSATIRIATPIALAALGSTLSERAGIINIGLEGMMLCGAFAAVVGSFYSGSPWLGVLFSLLGGGLVGFVLAFFILRLKADHVVAGIGINILAAGITTWLMQVLWQNKGSSPMVNGLTDVSIPVLRDIPILGTIIGTHCPLVYIMLFLVLATWLVLFKTPMGLRIRIIGEHPEAADSQGLNIRGLQYVCVVISGSLAGLGGAYLALGQLNWFSTNMSAGRGYMALAANIFGNWHPLGGLIGSCIFSFTDAVQMRLQNFDIGIPYELIQMFPYLMTIAVLAGAVIHARAPAALGRHYETNT